MLFPKMGLTILLSLWWMANPALANGPSKFSAMGTAAGKLVMMILNSPRLSLI